MAINFSDYLRLYKALWLKLQTKSPQLTSYADRSLYTTWQITLDRIQQANTASAKLLKLWAYFDRQDVWFELLRHASSADDQSIRDLVEDELNFTEAVALLCSYGLVNADRTPQQQFESGGYSMHSCVHSWTVFVLNEQWDDGLARQALKCVASEIPSTNEKNWWLLQRRLIQHATRQALFIENGKVDIVGLDWAFHSLGNLYADQGKLGEAEKMYVRALQGYEKALGPDHTSTLHTVNNLGLLYSDQGKLAEAEKMYVRALQGYEKALGPDHTSTLNSVYGLGMLYHSRCFYAIRRPRLNGFSFHSSLTSATNPLSDIVKLADFCIRYPSCRTVLLSYLCGMFRWINEDTLSCSAFSYQVCTSLPSYNAICDGCNCNLCVATGRFACKSCEDVDLCRSCFKKYEMDELKNIMTICQDHQFLELSKTSITENALYAEKLSIEQWLQELESILTS